MPSVNKKADEKKIRALDKQWGEAATRKDLDAVVAFYAPDGSLVWPDAPAVHGTKAAAKPGTRASGSPTSWAPSTNGSR